MHRTPLYPFLTISLSFGEPLSRMVSRTVGGLPPLSSILVESDFGSHPICITVRPISAMAAETFEAVVDFPMPPLPYIAILRIINRYINRYLVIFVDINVLLIYK
jgi:hypothetical protein